VTRATRPKKPSSSRGFAREASGAWGSWGPKIEFFFLSFQAAWTQPVRRGGGRGVHGKGRRGMSAFAQTFLVHADVGLHSPGQTLSARKRFLPRPRTVKTCSRVNPCPRSKRGRGRTSCRNGRLDGNFYRRTSIMIILLFGAGFGSFHESSPKSSLAEMWRKSWVCVSREKQGLLG
jgi:hypothetical protein